LAQTPTRRRGRPPGTGGKYTRGDPDAELERLITRRASQDATPDDGPKERDQLLAYHGRRAAANRWEWVRHHEHMHELHTALAEEHAEAARRLERREDRASKIF
jgi:hypothetical protein